MREPNPDKLNELAGKLVGDLGAAMAGASVLLGDRLGLYKAMARGEPVTSAELAKKTKLHERYVREWLSAQAASGYVDYDAEKDEFSLSPEQAMAFAEEKSPLFFAGAFDIVQATYLDEPKVEERSDSFGQATTPISSRAGSPRSTASRQSSRRAPRWPMSDVVMAPRPS